MRTILTAALAVFALSPLAVVADELDLQPAPGTLDSASSPVALPKKGATLSQVLKAYGEPQTRHPAVGGDSPKHPPITRWDYPGFTVIFEHAHVVDAVVPGRPAQLFHTDKLTPAAAPADS